MSIFSSCTTLLSTAVLFAVSGVGTPGTVFIHSAAKDGLFLPLQQYGTVMNTAPHLTPAMQISSCFQGDSPMQLEPQTHGGRIKMTANFARPKP